MKTHTRSVSRLLGRLLLLIGLLAGFGLLASRSAIPAHAATLPVSDCTGETGTGRIGTVISSANPGDTITFSCSGTIPITSTLNISTNNLTLDGIGQSVTLDGGNSVGVLSVNSGVSFTLKTLTIAHGNAPIGGGLDNAGGTVTISNSTFAHNSATLGGGLFNNGGTVMISNSTFASNSSFESGGGLFNAFGGTVTISNSTFANNSAFGGGSFGGGGLLNDGTVTISNSTFANNSAGLSNGGGLFNQSTLSIGGSIVANNSGGNCRGGVSDQGYNLESGTNCGFMASKGSLQNTDPLLSALADNGGPTQTLALLSGSPAIDVIPTSSNLCPTTDQRGVSRPDNGETACDMGAYEFVDPVDNDLGLSNVPADITTDATSPQGAVVPYTSPTVVDEDSPLPTVSCNPASGSTFAIGTTTVTCTVTDTDDTPSSVSKSFTVTVLGAAAQVSDLITTVNSMGLTKSLQTALDNKLKDALSAINAGQTATACSDLTDFIGFVQAHVGKGIKQSQANQLIAAATNIKKVLGCL